MYHLNLEKVENYLRQQSPIRFSTIKTVEELNVPFLLTQLNKNTGREFKEINLLYSIMAHASICPTAYATGLYKEDSRSRRTIKDLFLLTNYYYPDTSLKTFFDYLNELFKLGLMESIVCPDIHKRVFRRAFGHNYFGDFRANEYYLDLYALLPNASKQDAYCSEKDCENRIYIENYE